MRQTTRTKTTQRTAASPDDAGPYDYDLPPVRHAGRQPLAAKPRPAWNRSGTSWTDIPSILIISFTAPWLRGATGWRTLDCFVLLYAIHTLLWYWTRPGPRPKQGFVRWALKVVGIWLNCYVAAVTVPESLRNLLPEPLAFGLPAFLVTAVLYCAVPVNPYTGRKWPLWQWLLVAAWAAAIWGWLGPSFIE